jgi:hypothetical protein
VPRLNIQGFILTCASWAIEILERKRGSVPIAFKIVPPTIGLESEGLVDRVIWWGHGPYALIQAKSGLSLTAILGGHCKNLVRTE